MKHERTFGSLQTDGITSKNYSPPPKKKTNLKFLFSETFQRCLIEWRRKKITDCQRCSEATFSSLIVSFWEKEKKMADNNTHEMDNTKGLAPKTYGYVCAIRVRRRVSAWKIGHLLLDCRFQETASLASNLIRREEKPRPTAHADQQS